MTRFPCSASVYVVSLQRWNRTELVSASSKLMATVPSLSLLHCVFEETIVSAKPIKLSHRGICQPVKLIIYCTLGIADRSHIFYCLLKYLMQKGAMGLDIKKDPMNPRRPGHSQSAQSILRHAEYRHLMNLTVAATLHIKMEFSQNDIKLKPQPKFVSYEHIGQFCTS